MKAFKTVQDHRRRLIDHQSEHQKSDVFYGDFVNFSFNFVRDGTYFQLISSLSSSIKMTHIYKYLITVKIKIAFVEKKKKSGRKKIIITNRKEFLSCNSIDIFFLLLVTKQHEYHHHHHLCGRRSWRMNKAGIELSIILYSKYANDDVRNSLKWNLVAMLNFSIFYYAI